MKGKLRDSRALVVLASRQVEDEGIQLSVQVSASVGMNAGETMAGLKGAGTVKR